MSKLDVVVLVIFLGGYTLGWIIGKENEDARWINKLNEGKDENEHPIR